MLGDMLVDLQLSSAHYDWPQLRDAVLRAEAEGHDTTWILDHLDGTLLPGGNPDALECCTLLGALAASTTTIGLGTLVANVANRHPAVLAAALATAHRISGGRVRAGVGAGAAPGTPWAREHQVRGIPLLPTMAARHDAVIRQIDALRPIKSMPVIVGTNSVELAIVAGTHADGVNVRLGNPRAAEFLAAAQDAAAGRCFECSGLASVDDHAARVKAETLGLDRLILIRLGERDDRPTGV